MSDTERDVPEILDRPVPIDEGDELNRQRIVVRRRLPGRRLDKYLHGRYPRMSRTLLQRLIRQGAVTVNLKPTKPSYEPDAGDIIDLVIPPAEPWDVIPEKIPLNIIYEDEYIIVLNKQTGIICHPSRAGQTGTLANGLAYYAESLAHGEDPFRPGIVHRLDKNTTGVMVVAKTDEAHWRISLQFEKRTTQKTYFGIVEGEPELDEDVINKPLAAHPRIKDRYMVPGLTVRKDLQKEAITRYRVVERFQGFAAVEMYPRTGRTHQLRVHMSYIGHPMFGDTQYGGHPISEHDLTGTGSTEPLIPHQSLHAWRLRFTHPILEKPVEFEAPAPDNILRVLELLRKHRSR
jgi:23S rRNA pseudouridine1911/1915/1917 synthase